MKKAILFLKEAIGAAIYTLLMFGGILILVSAWICELIEFFMKKKDKEDTGV